jgi:hypothetical protein
MDRGGAMPMLGMFWNGRPNPGVQLEPGIHVVQAGVDGVTGHREDSAAETARRDLVGRRSATRASVACSSSLPELRLDRYAR